MNDDANEPRLVTCPCNHCGGHIEFDASSLVFGETQKVECPFCQCETTLTDPSRRPPVLPSPEEIRNQRVTQIKAGLRARLESGKSVFLYDSILVPVDSIVEGVDLTDEFNLSYLRQLGLLGWEIVHAVPKTLGIALKNVSFGSSMGETWGAGIGGNVTGVHIIIKKELSDSDLTDDPDDEVAEFIRNHLSDF